jgi:hypothetical protein
VHVAIVSDFGHVSEGAAKVAIESTAGLAAAGPRKDRHLAESLIEVKWSVDLNRLAVHAALAALEDEDYMRA